MDQNDKRKSQLHHVNVTLPLDESVRRVRTSWTSHSVRMTPDYLQQLSDLGLCVHSLSHMDLPYISSSLPLSKGATKDIYRRAFSLDCIILNLLGRMHYMERALDEAMKRQHMPGRLPPRPVRLWGRDQYFSIIRGLSLGVGELREQLGSDGSSDLDNTCLVMYTGWRAFAPLYKDCGHPHWWAWHPFLLHPYLTCEAAGWLKELSVKGIATDAVSPDSPLKQWRMWGENVESVPWDTVREAISAFEVEGDDRAGKDTRSSVHDILLGSGGFLLESLDLRSDILFLERGPANPPIGKDGVELPRVSRARITILPFSCEAEPEAALVYVLMFARGEREQ